MTICKECGGDLKYCEDCGAYHHEADFEMEHDEGIIFDSEGTQV